jgi:hypothetical protein
MAARNRRRFGRIIRAGPFSKSQITHSIPLENPFRDSQRRWQTNRCLWTKPNRVENTVCCRRYRPRLTVNFAPIVPKRSNLTFGTILSFVWVLMPFRGPMELPKRRLLPVGIDSGRGDHRRSQTIATNPQTSRASQLRTAHQGFRRYCEPRTL